jgi:hypothetical protein
LDAIFQIEINKSIGKVFLFLGGSNLEKKRKISPSYKKAFMILDKFRQNRVNSCKKLFLAPNLYDLNFMRTFLINKNLCLYYWLKKRIGKEWAFRVVSQIEKIILVFGREKIGERPW